MSEGVVESEIDHLTQKPSALHYLGPPGTYSHQVALETLPANSADEVVLVPCETIKSTFEQARKSTERTGGISWSLLPYENNSNGPVVDSYDILFAMEATTRIIGNFYLSVHHSLMCTKQVYEALKGDGEYTEPDLNKLGVVLSHSQALGQCSKFLQSNLRSDVELLNTTSTGEAARQLKEYDSTLMTKLHACISSKICAREDVYDLVILQEGIQNSNNNTTRFLLLETSKEETKYKVVEGKAELIRAMVRIETSATSNALSEFIKELSIPELECHIRSIERRAKKDAVDVVDMSTILDEGHWPFVYLIEVEASKRVSSNGHDRSTSRAQKWARKDGDGEALDFAASFYGLLYTAMACARESEGSESSAILLGIWS